MGGTLNVAKTVLQYDSEDDEDVLLEREKIHQRRTRRKKRSTNTRRKKQKEHEEEKAADELRQEPQCMHAQVQDDDEDPMELDRMAEIAKAVVVAAVEKAVEQHEGECMRAQVDAEDDDEDPMELELDRVAEIARAVVVAAVEKAVEQHGGECMHAQAKDDDEDPVQLAPYRNTGPEDLFDPEDPASDNDGFSQFYYDDGFSKDCSSTSLAQSGSFGNSAGASFPIIRDLESGERKECRCRCQGGGGGADFEAFALSEPEEVEQVGGRVFGDVGGGVGGSGEEEGRIIC